VGIDRIECQTLIGRKLDHLGAHRLKDVLDRRIFLLRVGKVGAGMEVEILPLGIDLGIAHES